MTLVGNILEGIKKGSQRGKIKNMIHFREIGLKWEGHKDWMGIA